MNPLPGQITSGTLPAPAGIADGDLVYGARPEYLELLLEARPTPSPARLRLENLGTSTLVTWRRTTPSSRPSSPKATNPPSAPPAWALPRRSLLYRDDRLP
ncbi:hypothetical protein [Nonomuraea aurantiaca]|uniref:hypothetical protein n=1 Tax=Nonomuraea aurantiaca TaxID=2878562 RepID=UPI001CD943AF|nr:hypothetical protein [Nonomuraea aurantiaca]MCA2222166.1 hypothetical protein [Nonomuraea aurantiaca]